MSSSNPAPERSTDRWENEGGPTPSPEMQSRNDLQSELERYGITPVQLTVFDWAAIATPTPGTRSPRQSAWLRPRKKLPSIRSPGVWQGGDHGPLHSSRS